MVANLTIGRKRFAAVETQVARIRERAEQLRDRAHSLIEEDSAAYGRVADAMAGPKGSEAERAVRRAAIQDALKGAVGPPLATMRAAAEVLDLAAELVHSGNPAAVSDVGTAAASARAGYDAARLNVEINLGAVEDVDWRARLAEELAGLPEVESQSAGVLAASHSIIRGGA